LRLNQCRSLFNGNPDILNQPPLATDGQRMMKALMAAFPGVVIEM